MTSENDLRTGLRAARDALWAISRDRDPRTMQITAAKAIAAANVTLLLDYAGTIKDDDVRQNIVGQLTSTLILPDLDYQAEPMPPDQVAGFWEAGSYLVRLARMLEDQYAEVIIMRNPTWDTRHHCWMVDLVLDRVPGVWYFDQTTKVWSPDPPRREP